MRALILFERSGTIRRAFLAAGWEAVSVDLAGALDGAPAVETGHGASGHLCADVFDALARTDLERVDLVIAHPVCQYLSSSGLHWNHRRPERAALTAGALADLARLRDGVAGVPMVAIENPIGAASRVLGTPTQVIQPYEYGHDASKRTALWLRGLPKLRGTAYVEPRMVAGKPRWANQTDSGQNKLPPSEDRAIKRAITYPGIAAAMATQWTSREPFALVG